VRFWLVFVNERLGRFGPGFDRLRRQWKVVHRDHRGFGVGVIIWRVGHSGGAGLLVKGEHGV